MTIEELIEALETKRELLKETIDLNNMDLNNKEVLAYSREVDDLITTYLSIMSAKCN